MICQPNNWNISTNAGKVISPGHLLSASGGRQTGISNTVQPGVKNVPLYWNLDWILGLCGCTSIFLAAWPRTLCWWIQLGGGARRIRGLQPQGGYSLYDGWYICAAVLTPFFDPLGTKLDLLGVFFLIHQHKNDLLGTNPRKIRSFWPQNTIFPSIFLGPIFSGLRHTPSNFRTEYPPRGFNPSRILESPRVWIDPTPQVARWITIGFSLHRQSLANQQDGQKAMFTNVTSLCQHEIPQLRSGKPQRHNHLPKTSNPRYCEFMELGPISNAH